MNQGSINGGSEIVLYEAADGGVRLDVKLEQETVWLTQLQMATLFVTTPENVLMHLKNIYAEKELVERSTTKDFLVVRTEGKRRVRRGLKPLQSRRHYIGKIPRDVEAVSERFGLYGSICYVGIRLLKFYSARSL